ncbi:MAG: beta-ketoacyl synthase [Flavobacteriaceae bacterium]|jgi:3-oxoacyl-[acyl-carrier-protein] synthase-1|nr:beta-ketoacyl synthase [Flavobacteriaceae bacterium]MBT4951020.1 beta-ketoacyl synthase [Pelagibacteraceae bacterium]MBT4415588.1 beta-ketoacyl synthase [Flavobacteriaceae bacterium]MBT5858115.1 beta-ketoacyl synthase [Flavobacteriaceae bacterium]MBT6689384.1 beta-ketoacyl synthase [Flavobacteriaceae bacterium]|tara:strand:+ start:7102 stop:8238 length:1137 start_codon:yes stop_codon:yes gene_type:complete
MKNVFITENNIISPLGFTSETNILQIAQEKSGITLHDNMGFSPYYASIIDDEIFNDSFNKIGDIDAYTKLEKMMILSLQDTISQADFSITDRTALLIATTKGNIDALDTNTTKFTPERAYLPVLGEKIKTFFNFKNEPIIISNACVSGILSIAIAKRLIQNNYYDNAFIVGGDIVSKFTLSGFQSFQAISEKPCKPFSKHRNGITIGEAAASVAISNKKPKTESIQVIGDGSCNDANHISGPSRDGEGLYRSIVSALNEAKITPETIDYISAHGTATLFNDEMEAIAFNRVKLESVPLNSLKGYYGHTLGASGLLEAIVGIHSMKNNTLYTSLGIDELGVSVPLNIIQKKKKTEINTFLKTASGFGGCNTAVLFKKLN